jgi:hypothetical protein
MRQRPAGAADSACVIPDPLSRLSGALVSLCSGASRTMVTQSSHVLTQFSIILIDLPYLCGNGKVIRF